MTQAAVRPRVSFEEYIDFCAQTDERWELVRGELVKMTPPTWAHVLIARFLERVFEAEIERLGYDWVAVRESGQRTESDSSRLPDVTVVPFDEIEPVLNQTAVLTVPAPIVVEIVSPSSSTEDYDSKLKEYQLLGVKEYWVVDHEGLGAAKYYHHL
jgi:Uma2 family endonuclease